MSDRRKPTGLHPLSQREERCQDNPGSRSLWGDPCHYPCRPQTDVDPPAGPGTTPDKVGSFWHGPGPILPEEEWHSGLGGSARLAT